MARTKNFAAFIRAKLAADPDLAEAVEAESFNLDIAGKVYEARVAAGLTQRQLADLIGTQQSVISRIEDADYDRHTLGTLKKIASALGKRLRVEFVPPDQGTPVEVPQIVTIDWAADALPAGHQGAKKPKTAPWRIETATVTPIPPLELVRYG
jgi:transcriptional regulator with XRE-family HTH domain